MRIGPFEESERPIVVLLVVEASDFASGKRARGNKVIGVSRRCRGSVQRSGVSKVSRSA